jgi:hypothetical protein
MAVSLISQDFSPYGTGNRTVSVTAPILDDLIVMVAAHRSDPATNDFAMVTGTNWNYSTGEVLEAVTRREISVAWKFAESGDVGVTSWLGNYSGNPSMVMWGGVFRGITDQTLVNVLYSDTDTVLNLNDLNSAPIAGSGNVFRLAAMMIKKDGGDPSAPVVTWTNGYDGLGTAQFDGSSNQIILTTAYAELVPGANTTNASFPASNNQGLSMAHLVFQVSAPAGPGVAGSTTDNSQTDTTVEAAQVTVTGADGGIAYAAVFADGTTDPGENGVRGATGAVQVGVVGTPDTVTFPQITTDNTGAALTPETAYELWTEAYGSDGTTASLNRDTVGFSTLVETKSVIIPLVNVSTGSPWPDGGNPVFYENWDIANKFQSPAQAADDEGTSTVAGGNVSFDTSLPVATPTFTDLYQEVGTAGISPEDNYGINMQNSVVPALVEGLTRIAHYVGVPDESVQNWVPVDDYLNAKARMENQVFISPVVLNGSIEGFTITDDEDIPDEVIDVALWDLRRYLTNQPRTIQSLTRVGPKEMYLNVVDTQWPTGSIARIRFKGHSVQGWRSTLTRVVKS